MTHILLVLAALLSVPQISFASVAWYQPSYFPLFFIAVIYVGVVLFACRKKDRKSSFLRIVTFIFFCIFLVLSLLVVSFDMYDGVRALFAANGIDFSVKWDGYVESLVQGLKIGMVLSFVAMVIPHNQYKISFSKKAIFGFVSLCVASLILFFGFEFLISIGVFIDQILGLGSDMGISYYPGF